MAPSGGNTGNQHIPSRFRQVPQHHAAQHSSRRDRHYDDKDRQKRQDNSKKLYDHMKKELNEATHLLAKLDSKRRNSSVIRLDPFSFIPQSSQQKTERWTPMIPPPMSSPQEAAKKDFKVSLNQWETLALSPIFCHARQVWSTRLINLLVYKRNCFSMCSLLFALLLKESLLSRARDARCGVLALI